MYLEKFSVAVEVQYLDNITKKNYLCSRRRLRGLRRLRRLGGLGGLGVVRQVRRVGVVRQVGVRAAPAEMWGRWDE